MALTWIRSYEMEGFFYLKGGRGATMAMIGLEGMA